MKPSLTILIEAIFGSTGAEAAANLVNDSNLGIIIVSVLSSGVFSAWLSWFLSRKNQEASAKKLQAEADNIVAETYGEILNDVRTELTRQKQALIDQATIHTEQVRDLEERHRRDIARAHERIDQLEQSEDQAVTHVKNLEKLLRELGVPLPETPWRPIRDRRRRRNGNGH